MSAAVVDAKVQGQMDSLLDLLQDSTDCFMDTITAIPVGREFSVNDIRESLDRYGVPEKSRAGLFSKAMNAGLIKPLVVEAGGRLIPVTVDSTGASAHRAKVKVYIRT